MSYGRWRNQYKRKARVEIIPLIDVMFLLLCFFVFATTNMMVQRGISVELASSQSSGEVRGTEFIVVSVDKSGKYFLNKKAVSEKELSAFLIKMKTSAEKNTVIVSADKEAYHGQVIKLLDIVRRSGVKTAVFSVRQENVDI